MKFTIGSFLTFTTTLIIRCSSNRNNYNNNGWLQQLLLPVLLVVVVVNAQDNSPVGSPTFNEIIKTYPTISTSTSTTIAPTPTVASTTNIPTPILNDTTTTPPAPNFFTVTTSSPVVTTNTPTGIVVNETLTPSSTSVINGTMTPTIFSNVTKNLDCTFPSEIDIKGDQTLLLRHVINPINQTVTVQLEYFGTSWVSFGFSTTIFMIPNIAVIGLPDDGTVLKYNMVSKLVDGVTQLSDDQQTLTDKSITQENGITTLTFTQPLSDIPNVPIVTGENTYIWAHGFSNPLATHDSVSRGGTTTFINECLEIGETSSPTVPPTIAPTVSPITRTPVAAKVPTEPVITSDGLDCSFQNDLDVRGDGIVMLRQVINPNNRTVTVQLEYSGEAWVSFGFSNTTKMVPNIAVIGLPDKQTVLKYDMTSQTDAGVYPLPDDQQTLMDKSIVQENGITTLTFTQSLDDLDGLPVVTGENMYLWSYGTSNPLAVHDITGRGDATATFTECLAVGETAAPIPKATIAPTKAPVEAPGPSGGVIDLGNGRIQRSVSIPSAGIDITFITDEPMATLTVEMTYAGIGYVSVGFSADPLMPDSLAVMALPDDGTGVPQKWDMGAAKTTAGVTLAPTERQTLMDASYSQNDTYTTMKFTKKFVEPNEQEIFLSGMNYILWAIGPSNAFQAHSVDGRGNIPIDFSSTEALGPVELSGSPHKNWWLVHGICLCIAWIILVPVAVSVSIIKSYFSAMPPGFWFRTHRNLNTIGVLLTIFGFAISVKLYADENGGSNAKHFKASQHHKVGLVIFLFAFLQAFSGFFRPPLPHKPDPVIDEKDDDDENVDEEQHDDDKVEGPAHVDHHPLTKSPQRIFFEYQHRALGVITMVLGWVNCDSGFDAFNKRFLGPDMTAAIWAVVGTIMFVTIILAIYDRCIRTKQ
jgi:hypothetical protein